jgi:hypothetical protein
VRARAVTLVALAALLVGCGDRIVTLRHSAPPPQATLAPVLVVVPFADVRGKEGDQGDPLRVGGLYGSYGNRVAKVMATAPWPPQLQDALVAEFRAAGVDAQKRAGPAEAPAGAKILDGEVRNFSTEARWSRAAHVSGLVRVLDAAGQVRFVKQFSARESEANLTGTFTGEPLEVLLNAALTRFVRTVATDPEIRAAIDK